MGLFVSSFLSHLFNYLYSQLNVAVMSGIIPVISPEEPRLQRSHLVGLRHGHALLHQQLDNLIVVGVSGQDDGRDVGSEVGELLVQ